MTSQCTVWEIRANEDLFTVATLKTFCTKWAKKWVFQLEKGDSGYRHWQGRISLIKKRTKDQLMKALKESNIPLFNYLQPTTNEEHRKTAFYQMKEDTRIEGPYMDSQTESELVTYIPKQYRNVQLYEWQQFILDDAKKNDNRSVNLIFDPSGSKGKSTLAAIAELMYDAIDLPPLNDFKELIALLCNICMDKHIRTPGLVFVDLPRAMRKDQLYGMYSAIEQIKKGKLYDIRHHYKSWWIDSPAVWVFSNIPPDSTLLSNDRWKIWEFEDNKLIPYTNPEQSPTTPVESSPLDYNL